MLTEQALPLKSGGEAVTPAGSGGELGDGRERQSLRCASGRLTAESRRYGVGKAERVWSIRTTLVAGDKDYVPTVEELVSDGFLVEVAFWSHAAAELRSACSKFIDLDPFVEHLQLT